MQTKVTAFAEDSLLIKKRVKFSPVDTTDTLEKGYALCYKYDGTTDANGTASSATGYVANEAYAVVEQPDANNLQYLAGFVAPESDGAVSGDFITLLVPGSALGSVLEVYTDLSVTEGLTLLAINAASYKLSTPIYGGSSTSCRVIGIAGETSDKSSTNGTVLAYVGGPYAGLTQGFGVSTNMQIGPGTSSGTIMANMISVESLQTGGSFELLRLRAELAGAGAGGGSLAARMEGVMNSTALTGANAATAHLIFKTGATVAADNYFAAFESKIENQDSVPANLASAVVVAHRFSTQLNDDPGQHYQHMFEALGSDKPDAWFYAVTADAVGWTSKTGSATFDGWIPVKIVGTTRYIPTVSAIA